MSALSARRNAFWSEADFQFELAQELLTMFPSTQIRLERPFGIVTSRQNRYYVDIVVVEPNGASHLVELKYKTVATTITDINGEKIILQNHSAHDFGCYDYLKDISRIEQLKQKNNNLKNGFAIMLTNDSSYYTPKIGAAYDMFRIYQGATKSGKLNWLPTRKGTLLAYGNRHNFSLSGSYTMNWLSYNNNFRYLITEII
jgi:hypothetical protein